MITGGRACGLALAGLLLAPGVLRAEAPAWVVDPSASRLGFVGTQGGHRFEGRFSRWRAEIRFDREALQESKVVVEIDVTSAGTGDATRDAALPQPDWFDAGRHAAARFETKAFRALGADRYEADAVLTIRGVARPVTLPFRLDIAGDAARMDGVLSILRTDFGVGQGVWATDQVVGLEVRVEAQVQARRR